MKVKTVDFIRTEKETDLEYPVYLYEEDSDNLEYKYIKVDENGSLIITHSYYSTTIEINALIKPISQYDVEHNLIDEKTFNDVYNEVKEKVNK